MHICIMLIVLISWSVLPPYELNLNVQLVVSLCYACGPRTGEITQRRKRQPRPLMIKTFLRCASCESRNSYSFRVPTFFYVYICFPFIYVTCFCRSISDFRIWLLPIIFFLFIYCFFIGRGQVVRCQSVDSTVTLIRFLRGNFFNPGS